MGHGTKIDYGTLKRAAWAGLRCKREGVRLNSLRLVPSEQHVPNGSRRAEAMGVQADAYPALCVVRQVLCVVKPPRPVVVPEVVVRVAADADGDL